MFEIRTPKAVVMAKFIKTILWIHFTTALVCVLVLKIELSQCAVTGIYERATSCYPECPAGKYCNELSDVCEECSCCCQDQIDHRQFEDECVDTSPAYNWCKEGSCPKPDCVQAPTPTAAVISSATQVQNITSITPTGTPIVITTATPTNGTDSPYSTVFPQPHHGGMTKNLDAIMIGSVVGALLVIILILTVYMMRKRKICQKSSCRSAYLDQNSVAEHEVRVDEETSPAEDQCQNDGRVCEAIPVGSQSPPDLSSHGNRDGNIDDDKDDDDDDDDNDAFDNDDERQSLIKKDKNKKKSTKRKEHQPETSCIEPITQIIQSTRDMSQSASNSQKDCTFTVKEMMENMDLIEDLSELLDVPVSCTQGAHHLGAKFANLDYKKLKFLDHHSSAEKPLTKYVFDKIHKTNSRLKCVEIVKFLQEELRMNDVVVEIQKHHPHCEGCCVYYDRI